MQRAGKLWELRDDIREGRSQKRLRAGTIKWIVKVGVNENKVMELDNKYNDINNHPWKLPHFWKGASLSKDMVEMCEEVHSLWQEGMLKRGRLEGELPNSVEVIPPSKIEYKSSLHKYVEEALSFLEDPEIRRIGIWGIVGTGKTTIMKYLNNHDNIDRMFDIVIWVTVPKEWSVVGFQQKIMDRLQLNMGSTTDTEKNTQIIFEELKKKKCLILLDEVCHLIELEKIIGVHDIQNCKVVLASRDRGICRDMDVDQLINVKPLSDDEALKMFKEKVGECINNIPKIIQVAQLLVKECWGLPLLVDKLAKTFKRRGRDIQCWRDGRRSLQIWLNKEGKDEVLELLEFCYNSLDSDAKKDCFLYCALYSEEPEIHIRCLLECWRLEGFIRNDGHEILSHLINVSLLESSGNKKSVKMNKVHRISLMDNELHSLPETPDCRDLLTLLLQRNENLIAIPKLFFTSMCCLRVLDLHGTGIKSLPSSLCNLIVLRGLYLNSCNHLVGLPTDIEALKQLEPYSESIRICFKLCFPGRVQY
ncbi:hypothetical protein AAG906_007660 [Vitis piasezkii]